MPRPELPQRVVSRWFGCVRPLIGVTTADERARNLSKKRTPTGPLADKPVHMHRQAYRTHDTRVHTRPAQSCQVATLIHVVNQQI
jgi:hypothetical protein